MTETTRYNLGVLRDFMIDAFDTGELQALVLYDEKLNELHLNFATADSIKAMVDKTITWCDRRGLIGYLIDRVKEQRPDKKFEAELVLTTHWERPPLLTTPEEPGRTARFIGGTIGHAELAALIAGVILVVAVITAALIALFSNPPPETKLTPFTTPAAEDELLIIVAEFEDNSTARNLDVPTVLVNAIHNALPDDIGARVVAGQDLVLTDRSEAASLGNEYGASIVIWGQYSDNCVELNFTPMVELYVSTDTRELWTTQLSVEELAIIVNDLAPGQVRWLSLFTIGQVMLLKNLPEDAIARFKLAIDALDSMEAKPDNQAATYLYRGFAYYTLGELDKAEPDLRAAREGFSQIITSDLPNAGTYYHGALASFLLGDYEMAVADLDECLSLNREDARCHELRGHARREMGAYEQAIDDYGAVISLRSEDARGYMDRGSVYSLMRDYEQALPDFDECVKLDPDNFWHYISHADVLFQAGEYGKAFKDYDQAVALASSEARAYTARGLALSGVGKYENALADLKHAVELDPNYIRAVAGLAATHQRMGELEAALVYYDSALSLDDDYFWAWTERGITHRQIGRYEEALNDLDRAVALNPANDWALYNRALTWQLLEKPAQVQSALNSAIEGADRQYRGYQEFPAWRNTLNLALYHLAAGNTDDADRLYHEVVDAEIPPHFILEAIQDLDEFLKVFAVHPQGKDIRARLQTYLQESELQLAGPEPE